MLELASIIILGIFAQWISWKMKLPAILPLILIGLFFGPVSSLLTADGHKWINPIYNISNETGMFPENTFFFFVSLAIGLILFEGGLTLKIKDFRNVSSPIVKLILWGPVITLIGASAFTHYIMKLDWGISFLFASLIIVTGPTVIVPILRHLPIKRNVAAVLKWEGILIDPIGALIAVLVFEFILSGESSQHFTLHALQLFGKIVLIGVSFGFTAAYFLNILVKKKLIPHYLLNVFTLALVLSVFVFSDILAGESGLLAVVVMGIVLGNLNVSYLKSILDFKESLSVLLISILFIILSAAIDIENLKLLLDYRVLIIFIAVVFILRPIVVFLSSVKSILSFREKIYISLMGPRGIVAAGIASLFGMRLTGKVPGAEYIIPLVFMIVLGTVIFNALTAKPFAKILKILKKKSDGFLFVGAHSGAVFLAKYLKKNGKHVVLVDNSEFHINEAENEGLDAYRVDIYSDAFGNDFDLLDMGFLLALTPSSNLNKYVIDKYGNLFGENGSYRLINDAEVGLDDQELSEKCAFSCKTDYNVFAETIRDYPYIHEQKISDKEMYITTIDKINQSRNSIPVFIKDKEQNISVLQHNNRDVKIQENDILVYVGEKLENRETPEK